MLIPSVHCAAQDIEDFKVHFGLAWQPAARLSLFPSGNAARGVWGNVGLCLATVIEGMEENTLALSLKTGFSIDFTRYNIPVGNTFIVDRGSIFLNPEILFPATRRLKIAAGFGVEFNGYFLAQMEGDSGNVTPEELDKIEDARRKALAYLSTGLQYNLRHSIFLHLFLRQMLMDVFRGETTISYPGNNGEERAKLNQAPGYIGIGLVYFFQ